MVLGITIAFMTLGIIGIIYNIYYNKDRTDYEVFENYATFWSDHEYVKLTFDEFIKYYNLNPKSWYVIERYIYYYSKNNKYYITFNTYKDYKKFIKWFADKEKREQEEEELKMALEFCDCVKAECEAQRKKSEEQIHKAIVDSSKLLAEAIKNDAVLSQKYVCKVNDEGMFEIFERNSPFLATWATPSFGENLQNLKNII